MAPKCMLNQIVSRYFWSFWKEYWPLIVPTDYLAQWQVANVYAKIWDGEHVSHYLVIQKSY